MGRRDIIGKDLVVALQVLKTSKKDGEIIYFSKLVKILEGKVSRNRISKALDRLFDEGILTAEFIKKGSRWVRVLNVTGEAEGFLENIYDQVTD